MGSTLNISLTTQLWLLTGKELDGEIIFFFQIGEFKKTALIDMNLASFLGLLFFLQAKSAQNPNISWYYPHFQFKT